MPGSRRSRKSRGSRRSRKSRGSRNREPRKHKGETPEQFQERRRIYGGALNAEKERRSRKRAKKKTILYKLFGI